MAPELVAGGGYGGLIREKPYCAMSCSLADKTNMLLIMLKLEGHISRPGPRLLVIHGSIETSVASTTASTYPWQ